MHYSRLSLALCAIVACNAGEPSSESTATGTTATDTDTMADTEASTSDHDPTSSTSDEPTDTTATDETTSTTMPPEGACACMQSNGGGYGYDYVCGDTTDCGTYVSYDGNRFINDPCDAGGDPVECDALTAANQAVVTCVVETQASDEALSFRHAINPGDIFTYDRAYWLVGDGTMFNSRLDWEDLCYEESAAVFDAPSLAACDGWDCIVQAVEGATLAEACLDDSGCPKG